MFLFIFSFKKKSTKTIPLAQDPKNILKQILWSQHFFRPVIMLHDHELWSCCLIMVSWSCYRINVPWSCCLIIGPVKDGPMITIPCGGWSYDHYSLWRMVPWSLFPVEDGPMIIIPCGGWSHDHYSLCRMVPWSLFPVQDNPMIRITCGGWSHDH